MNELDNILAELEEVSLTKDEANNTSFFTDKSYAMANSLIRLPNPLPLTSLQIFGLALSKVDWTTRNPKDVNNQIEVSFTLAEVAQACGSSSHNSEWYKNALINLQKKTVLDINENGQWLYGPIITLITMDVGRKIKVKLNADLNPYIEALGGNFTVFTLASTYKFRSRYAYILYANLCSWQNHSRDREDPFDVRSRYYSTRDLKKMFDLKEDDYVVNGHFNRTNFEKYVIKKAVEEINEYSNIRVLEWRKSYEGKSVKHYIFTYRHATVAEDPNTGLLKY